MGTRRASGVTRECSLKSLQRFWFLQVIIIVAITSIILLLIGIAYEYRNVRQEISELVQVREEYQNYVLALKRLITEYQKNSVEDGSNGAEKKKLTTDESQEFLILNRDSEYLKRSALQYARLYNMHGAVEKLYKDASLQESDPLKKGRSKKKPIRKRTILTKQHQQWLDRPCAEAIFIWPISKGEFWLSSPFGPRKKPDGSWGFHHAIDMAAVRGTPVKAAGEGIVIEAGYSRGYGNTVVIAHNRKFKTRYAHLEKILIKVGVKVEAGQIIGKVGDTGFVRKRGRDASHLHFEVSVFGKRVNPLYFLT